MLNVFSEINGPQSVFECSSLLQTKLSFSIHYNVLPGPTPTHSDYTLTDTKTEKEAISGLL